MPVINICFSGRLSFHPTCFTQINPKLEICIANESNTYIIHDFLQQKNYRNQFKPIFSVSK